MDRVYNSDYGLMVIHENVPDELVPIFPDSNLELELERVYRVGGNIGGERASLVKQDVFNESGEIIGTSYFLKVPFDGYFLHLLKVTDEVRERPLVASTRDQIMAQIRKDGDGPVQPNP